VSIRSLVFILNDLSVNEYTGVQEFLELQQVVLSVAHVLLAQIVLFIKLRVIQNTSPAIDMPYFYSNFSVKAATDLGQ
jgi:hypothetical protein